MKLPHASRAQVPEAKIVKYLLNPEHRVGKSKAAFFLSFGFRAEKWQELADALRKHAEENEIVEAEETPFGTRYVVDGTLIAPDGSRLNVRSAWFIDKTKVTARFASAHPLKRKP
jgi:hypothetical protein